MKPHAQTGITLVEIAVAAGIAVVALGGVFYALTAFGKYVNRQADPTRAAALLAAQQTLRTAQDAWKYGAIGDAPAGSQYITLAATKTRAVAAMLTTSIARVGTSAQITVTISYTPGPDHQDSGVVSASAELSVKAPLPGARLRRPGLVPLPSGAP